VRALSGGADPNFFWLTAAYAFAWLLGFLVPFLPGGLGLREGTLVAFLAPTYGVGVATTLALALRLANTLGEFAAIGAVEAGHQAQLASGRGRQRQASK
jgi:glycosyltransferase 2 family protein